MLNQRDVQKVQIQEGSRRRVSILVEFPEERLETVIVQWESIRPTALVQLKRNPQEPIQFLPGIRKDMLESALQEQAPARSAEEGASKQENPPPSRLAPALDSPLQDFVDPCTGKIFGKEAYLADLVVSANAYSLLQPEPDLVLEGQTVWEARAEALRALGILDEPLG